MNRLQMHGIIRKERLNSEHWFQSFLLEAVKQGQLTGDELRGLQEQLVQLMVYLATRYTAGASTSIREETAQSLMAGAVYSIGHTLKKKRIDTALRDLREIPLKTLYHRGQTELRELLSAAKARYATLIKNGVPLGSVTWQSTMYTGLAEFFAAYHVYDTPHESPGLIDYPTALPLDGAGGVEYITRYLKRLTLEDSLIRRWSLDEVNGLIRAGGAVEAPVNVFTLVLTNALGAVLCGRRPDTLSLSREDTVRLRGRLSDAPLRVLLNAAEALCGILNIKDGDLSRYISDTTASLVPVVKNALATQTLPHLFLTIKSAPKTAFFHDAPRMDDKQFRALVQEISECDDPKYRAELVSMHAACVADLADLFETGCLTNADIQNVLGTLGDEPLAALLCICRDSAADALHTSETELVWRMALTACMSSFEEKKQRRIRDMALHMAFV